MKKRTNYLGRNFKRIRSADRLSKSERSSRMSVIRSRNTKFEKDFFTLLSKSTRLKYSTHSTQIKGKPDIVFEKRRICIFLDSDFWHGWNFPRWRHLLKDDFWRTKIEKNRKRDRYVTAHLRRRGWKVLRFWEHQIKENPEAVIKNIISA